MDLISFLALSGVVAWLFIIWRLWSLVRVRYRRVIWALSGRPARQARPVSLRL